VTIRSGRKSTINVKEGGLLISLLIKAAKDSFLLGQKERACKYYYNEPTQVISGYFCAQAKNSTISIEDSDYECHVLSFKKL
jgi:hypothetical protein